MHVHFKGFEPEQDAYDKWEQALDRLLEKAPSGCSLYCCVVKEKGKYWGSIKIKSLQGSFATFCRAKEYQEVQENLINRILEQIKIWQECRFEDKPGSVQHTCDTHWMTDEELKHFEEDG